MRRFLASVAFASFAVVLLGPPPAHAQQDPASRALHFLAGKQAADGHVDGFDPSQGTEDFLIGAAAAGYDPNTLRNLAGGRSGFDYLAANVASATVNAGRTGRLLQAVVAAGRPTTFAGVNLVARLESDLYNPVTGRYGDSDSIGQGLAIVGLRAAGRTIPPAAVTFLEGLQNPDGSWYFGPPPSPAGSAAGDTNSTAFALLALDAAGDHSRDSKAFAYLHLQQQGDGGFPYQALYPGSDADSTALVIEALLGAGESSSFAGWTKPGGANPNSWLVANQDPASGGFLGYLGTPDAATTVQAVVGLALATTPVTAVHGTGFGLCSAASAGVASLRFLAGRQAADGHVDGFSPSQGTEDYILGAVAAGYDPGTLRAASGVSAYDFLATNVAAATATAGATGRLLEAVSAGGRPTVFGGIDLVPRLETTLYNPASGQYGAGTDAFGQSLAILGLRAADRAVPAPAVGFLKSLRNPDGSWYFSLVAGPGDTNDTAIAVMALDAAGDHSLDGSALTWLRAQQVAAADGGFPYQAAYPPSDPVSTGLVLQALFAAAQDPATWSAAGATPLMFLAQAQDAVSGGYPGYAGTPDVPTTVPVVVALEHVPYPVLRPFGAGRGLADAGLMAGVCASTVPPPSPTPSPTPTAGPTPTPGRTPTPTAAPAPSPSVTPSLRGPAPASSPVAPPPVAAAPSPTPSPQLSASPSPKAVMIPAPDSSPQQVPPAVVTQPPPAAGSGGLPVLLLYALAGFAGLALVGAGGAAYLVLRRR